MGGVVKVTPRPLYPLERPGTYCMRGWVWTCEEISTPSGFDSRTTQPIASHYTNSAEPELLTN